MRPEKRLFQAWREHHLIHAINQVVFELDEKGRLTFLNAAWAKLSGYPVAATEGSYLCDYLAAEDQPRFEALVQGAWEGGEVQALLHLHTNDGSIIPINLEAKVLPHEAGGRLAMVGTLSAVSAPAVSSDGTMAAISEARLREAAQLEKQVAFAVLVAQRFTSGEPSDHLYAWFVEALTDAFQYDQTQLYLYDAGNEAMMLVAASRTAIEEAQFGQERLVELASGDVIWLAGRPPSRQPPFDGPEGSGALAAPITLGGALLGVVVAHLSHDVAADEHRLLLRGLAAQLATLIEGVRLRQETSERMAELDNLQRLMQRDAWLRAEPGSPGKATSFRFDRRLMQIVEAPEQEAGEGRTEALPGANEAQNVLSQPLTVRGQTFGFLAIEDDPDNPLSAADMQFLESISHQVSEAMENARLLEQTQKRAVELETVARVSTATSTILDKDKLLQGVVELTRRSFNLYHAHIYLLDEHGGELVLAAGSGEAGRQMVEQGWHIALGEPRSIVATAARERNGIIVNDVRKETGFLPNPLLPLTRAELAVPMMSGNRLLGVLDVQSDMVNYFTQDDVRIQSALAGQVATALQNATLYQEQLETAEKLREFDRLKSEFLASMSHELRTPLNSIIGFADVLLEGIDGELNERMREDVQLIRNSGQHLRELIGDILDMSKIEAGMMDLRYETIDIASLRHEIEGFARTQLMAYDKELQFSMHLSPQVSTVEADLTRFKQVLFNLVSNAIKFTAEGAVNLELDIAEDKLLVCVSDTGIGIKEDHIPIIFEQFRQVDGSLTRTAGGTGLGLPISKSLVELHGGDIWVESAMGAGTNFYFTIPLQQPRARRGPGYEVIAETSHSG